MLVPAAESIVRTLFVTLALVFALSLVPTAVGATYALIGAGDIAGCTWTADTATGDLIRARPGATVWTAGDNAYESGTVAEFNNCYGPAWGSFRGRTKPTPGNHEYLTLGASGYFAYFPVRSYYAYNIGANWRIYALNSNIAHGPGSAQYTWLRRNLAAHPRPCIVAVWHHPLLSSARHGGYASVKPLWDLLHAVKAELVLNGHRHVYERFAKMRPNGTHDRHGLREVVVGTGGARLVAWGAIHPLSQARNNSAHGVLLIRLNDDLKRYDARFLPIAGKTYSDRFGSPCSP
jgi:Calcineurin-like phosphoesterase